MSRLNLSSLGAAFVEESSDSLIFFFTPGEGKQNTKTGKITYQKKKEGKVPVPEQYLEIKRTEKVENEVKYQVLTLLLNTEKVATFSFSQDGKVSFVTEPAYSTPKLINAIPSDPTFGVITSERPSSLFSKWLLSDRFEEYLISEATELNYTTLFVKTLFFFLAYLSHRTTVSEDGNVSVRKDTVVDLSAVGKTYLSLITKLHNASERGKRLFSLQPLLLSASSTAVENQESEKPTEDVLSTNEDVEAE